MVIHWDHVPDLILHCHRHEVNSKDLHQVRLHYIYAGGAKTLCSTFRAQDHIHLLKGLIIVMLRDQLSHSITPGNCDGVFTVIEQQCLNATSVISVDNSSSCGNTLLPSQTTAWCNATIGSMRQLHGDTGVDQST